MWKKTCLAFLVLAVAMSASAWADIVYPVDFHAIYNTSPPHTPPNDGWTVITNRYGYADPFWETTSGVYDTIAIDNIYVKDWVKWVWLEVEYTVLPQTLPDVDILGHLPPPGGNSTVTEFAPVVNSSNNCVTWKWLLVPQPDEEKIFLPDTSFYFLDGIRQIEVATLCVPLPSSAWAGMVLLAMVFVPSVRRVWKG